MPLLTRTEIDDLRARICDTSKRGPIHLGRKDMRIILMALNGVAKIFEIADKAAPAPTAGQE